MGKTERNEGGVRVYIWEEVQLKMAGEGSFCLVLASFRP